MTVARIVAESVAYSKQPNQHYHATPLIAAAPFLSPSFSDSSNSADYTQSHPQTEQPTKLCTFLYVIAITHRPLPRSHLCPFPNLVLAQLPVVQHLVGHRDHTVHLQR